MTIRNIFAALRGSSGNEVFETVLQTGTFRLERIISTGQASPPGHWYDQDQNEWIILLSGSASLLLDGEPEPCTLHPGDFLLIPAHQRHRVLWTAAGTETVWLALHYIP